MQAELTLEGRIAKIITPSLNDLGYDLVKVIMIGDDNRKILQIMIERLDGVAIGIDDCEKSSRRISAILDVEESELGKYNLEVSSPGIDRPLVKLKDFEKYIGYEVKFEVIDKIDDKRKFRGDIKKVAGDIITIDTNIVPIKTPEAPHEFEVDFNNIKNAKLVLNDKLLAMHKKSNI
ncbi:MAG: ribosome maturation factor RimP [Rickettsiales bacterium]|nr:ribosome maturation factor RimP [Pseudomonadota bacterium]MDA0966355.1 ribosome maturation factor RimP [Pseudomonadota bacterium]MDG4543987.1 ribosome maturation factor RimP [Rickettsiales bacterium]MDG4545481.1 ribosome maturation factor RimP [Rickettsiales bacterium]MDG4547930.1 ribosome maturation factor RimP [Rickettsiales bacterium]